MSLCVCKKYFYLCIIHRLSFFLERLSFTPPTHVLRWRYQYPCHRSDTAHAVSINILQSPILLHLNYLLCMIRLYILSKPNPKWRIWLLVCLSWIFKSSIQKGLESTNLACSGAAVREEAVLEWWWRAVRPSDSPKLAVTFQVCLKLKGLSAYWRRQAAVPRGLPPHRRMCHLQWLILSSHPRSICQAVPKSDKHGGHSRQTDPEFLISTQLHL